MRTQGTHSTFTLIVKMPEKWLSSTCGKSNKNNLRIISKPHVYLQTMYKSLVKFQRNRQKTAGGVGHTRYPLSIHFDSKNVQIAEKVTKNNLRIISKLHAYLQTMTKTSVKFRKNRHKTVGGVAHTRYIVLWGDGRTDGRTEGRTESRKLCPSAFLRKGGGQQNSKFTQTRPCNIQKYFTSVKCLQFSDENF